MAIPQELRDLKQWVCWRLMPDKSGGKDRKMPFNPETVTRSSWSTERPS